jgi:flagellar L-ring protein precursor FlgH
MTISRSLPAFAAVSLAALSLGACNTLANLESIGEQPAMSKTSDPAKAPGYQPVSMPVPNAVKAEPQAGSIWQPGARAFFKDQRAGRTGDVLTVVITINDSAILNNQTQGTRGDSDNVALTNLFGLETQTKGFLPNSFNPASAVNTSDKHVQDGQAQINRSEQINIRVAAEVTQVLPNGNLVINAKQEVRVNFEDRELDLSGVVRASDIDDLDEITYDKIAEARISYGGHGQGTDLQQQRVGSQIVDKVSPF